MKRFKIVSCFFAAALFFASCNKEYSIEGTAQVTSVGAWQFNNNSVLYTGSMDSAYVDSSSGNKSLHLVGTSSDGVEKFYLTLYAGSFTPGTYKASLYQSSFQYKSGTGNVYEAGQLIGEFIVTITAINATSVSGTFSGSANNVSNSITQITEGVFSASFSAAQNNGQSSSGTLGGGGGDCTPFADGGNYQQGITLDATNTVQIQVNVTSVGTYNITSNVVNGVSFSKAGVFTTTGVQTINLTGNGTPVNPGATNFTITFGSSVCNFTISFAAGVASSNDYFPLASNSNWTYALVGGLPTDSLYSAVIGYAPVFAGNTYSTIAYYNEPFSNPATDSAYFRKPGGDYYQYTIYSKALPFDQTVTGEYIFLKDNVAAGTTWNSPTISGTISGIAVTAYIKMTLLEKAVAATVGTFTFPDVIKVKYEYYVSGNPNVLITDERWFAKNVGEIHDDYNDLSLTGSYNITTYQVF